MGKKKEIFEYVLMLLIYTAIGIVSFTTRFFFWELYVGFSIAIILRELSKIFGCEPVEGSAFECELQTIINFIAGTAFMAQYFTNNNGIFGAAGVMAFVYAVEWACAGKKVLNK